MVSLRMRYSAAILIALLSFALNSGCQDVEAVLGDGGTPRKQAVVGTVHTTMGMVPPGSYLYCVTNIGRTMIVFDLEEQAVLRNTQTVLEIDPVGPWFDDQTGYYLARVAYDGSGKNALISFNPTTLEKQDTLVFPPNSNPAAMQIFPETGIAWIALNGSTYDDWKSNGIVVVALKTMTQTGYLDLNASKNFANGERVVSMLGFLRDTERGWVYALASNWYYGHRRGWLFVLVPDEKGTIQVLDKIQLGVNPFETLLLDPQGELWIPNNGGFHAYGGAPGTVQVLNPSRFNDGITGNETIALLEIGGDPTGIYLFQEQQAWVTMYPNEVVEVVNLETNSLVPSDASRPRVTGPLLHTAAGAILAGFGGESHAELGQLDPVTGALLTLYDLDAGNGNLSCSTYEVR